MEMDPGESGAAVQAGAFRRGLAYLLDCAVVFGLVMGVQVVLLVPVREALGIGVEWFHSGLHTQLYTLGTISLPVWLYFALTEASRRRATPGKMLLRLRVESTAGERLGAGRSLLRTVVKLLPWEIAHLANNLPVPVWFDPRPDFRAGFAVSALVLAALVASVAFGRHHRGLHDRAAGARVVRVPAIRSPAPASGHPAA